MRVRVASGDVVVRYVSVGDDDEPALPRMLPQLTTGERDHAARFRFTRDRLAFALGRVLVRRTLSQFSSPPAGGWQFASNTYGKPELTGSPGAPPLRFNISHCAGMVTAAFALGRDIGVDVESVARSSAGAEIARTCFAPEEIRAIESLPERQQQLAFVSIWTLKEAYVKAIGMGLSIPLADFAIGLNPPVITFSPRLADDDSRWFLWQDHPTAGYCLAVAARRRPGEELRMCIREVGLDVLL
jgi:4'-phosphopantetheinyl transferase